MADAVCSELSNWKQSFKHGNWQFHFMLFFGSHFRLCGDQIEVKFAIDWI